MSTVLQSLSATLAETVETAGAAVVRVDARRRLPASGIIWSADGVIITARHVIRAKDNISVGLPDGQTLGATLVGHDASTDLAVLKVDASGLSPAAWQSDMQVGHLVLALGRPGKTVQATLGVVSALGEAWRTPAGGHIDQYLQTDVLMYPGFSGGPLVGAGGQFLGLNSSALLRGVSIAVPAGTLRRVADALLTHGRIKRGYLGISTQPVRLPQAARDGLGQETGLLVVGVEQNSPADQSGLVLGDTITHFDGQAIRSHDDLLAQLSGDRVNQKVPVGIVRGGEIRTINVTVGERE